MKRFTKIMYDGLRSSVQQPKVEEITVVETLQAEAFQIAKVVTALTCSLGATEGWREVTGVWREGEFIPPGVCGEVERKEER